MNSIPLLLLGLLLALPTPSRAQTPAAQTPAAQTPTAQTLASPQATAAPAAAPLPSDPKAKKLLDQMVQALGGDLWLNRHDIYSEGHTASFFHGEPNGLVIPFWDFRLLPDLERTEYTKKRDDVLLFNATSGYEITYKGKKELPKDQLEDFFRRRRHSIEDIVQRWVNLPGVVLVYEGRSMVGRRLADKITLLAPDNDSVTLELDQNTHLPLRRSYKYRNQQFRDWDEDAEEYEDYHTIQGLPTAFSITRYHNGEMQNERFITKIIYNQATDPDIFNIDKPLLKRK
jgi:hypothetical protein